MKWKSFLFLTVVLTQFQLNSTQRQVRKISPSIQRRIDNFVQNIYLPTAGIPGISLAIVQNDGETLYTTGYGMANIRKGIPVRNNTQFLMASITKSFTSVVAAKLLHEKFPELGESVLDTPIRKLLPEANFTLNDRFRSENANFRDLLAHRLCLLREDIILWADPFDTKEEIAYRTRYNTEICGVRAQYNYNNQIYVLAGELIGILAGKPYEDVVQDLLNDLAMSETTFIQNSDDFYEMPNRAQPYYVLNGKNCIFNQELVKRIAVSKSAAGLLSTPDDMAIYLRFHLNLGNIDGKQIVPKEVMEWVRRPDISFPGISYKKFGGDPVLSLFAYSQGFILSSYDGWEYTQHMGYLPPFLSQMSLYPEKNLGIYSNVHAAPVKVNQYCLHTYIFEVLQGRSDVDAVKKVLALESQLKRQAAASKKASDEALQKYYVGLQKLSTVVGTYGSGSAGETTVSMKFDTQRKRLEYYFEYGRWYKGWLEPEGDEITYKIRWDTDVRQDDYASSDQTYPRAIFANNSMAYIVHGSFDGDSFRVYDRYQQSKMVGLTELPTIPWSGDSCGPEDNV